MKCVRTLLAAVPAVPAALLLRLVGGATSAKTINGPNVYPRRARFGFASRIVFAALVSSASLTWLTAAPASAAVLDVSCAGNQTTQFNPGLTFALQQTNFKVDGALGPCVSLTNPEIVGGEFHGTGSGLLSCTAGTSTSKNTIKWNTEEHSTVQTEININAKPNGTTVLISKGTVTSGKFKGAQVVITRTLANTDLLGCATPDGVTATSGPITMTVAL